MVFGAPAIAWSSTTVKYSRCRVYPATTLTPVAIAGLSKANPAVVTWTGHGLATGDVIFIDGITQDLATHPTDWLQSEQTPFSDHEGQ